MNSLELYDPNIVDSIIKDYNKQIRDRLVNGEEVEIEGVGKLKAKFRKVKNMYGRDYAIRVKVVQDKEFSRSLVSEYRKDNTKYKNNF